MATSTTRKAASPAPAKNSVKASIKTTAGPTSRKPTSPKAASVKAAPAPAPAAADKTARKKDKPEKVKVVRDSFTIPKTEYAQIAALKKRAMSLGIEAKKSELIRAGLLLLSHASDTALGKALGNVPTLKTGRPGKA